MKHDSLEAQDLLSPLKRTVLQLVKEFEQIDEPRTKALRDLSAYISYKLQDSGQVFLNFICTHNSRRSHIAQIWAQTASYFYGIENVTCLSGGTEATALSPNVVDALKDTGFGVVKIKQGENPLYSVMYSEGAKPLKIFSKRFDDAENASADFAAIMVCSDADENCPVIPNVSLRLPLPYDDPKAFDGTPQQQEKYLQRVRQIGREMLFVFSNVR